MFIVDHCIKVLHKDYAFAGKVSLYSKLHCIINTYCESLYFCIQ